MDAEIDPMEELDEGYIDDLPDEPLGMDDLPSDWRRSSHEATATKGHP